MHGGLFKRIDGDVLAQRMISAMGRGNLSNGQICLLATLSRSIPQASPVAAFLTWAIEQRWERASYHLRLALVDAAGCCWRVPEPQRSALADALESRLDNNNPFINTSIFESLQSLGASEDQEAEYVAVVCDQLGQLLTGNDDAEACDTAYGLYVGQFDHPYSSAYCEAIGELSGPQKDQFHLMAARGARDRNLFLPILLTELVAIGGELACEVLRRWTEPPPVDAVSPQEAIEIFVTAHIGLAKLEVELPPSVGECKNSAEGALRACGIALYWANRADLSPAERHLACANPWRVLKEWERGAALVAIRNCTNLHLSIRKNAGTQDASETLPHFFPAECADVCRRALENPDRQIGYFQYFTDFDRYSALSFAVAVLSEHGSASDLTLLRALANDSHLGQSAVKGVRALEARLAAL